MQATDYYRTMGIKSTASDNEIKHAYRRLARRFHPDVSGDPDGEAKFKALAEAYQTLKHPDLRAAYDARTLPVHGGDSEFPACPVWHVWLVVLVLPAWVRFWSAWQIDPHPEI